MLLFEGRFYGRGLDLLYFPFFILKIFKVMNIPITKALIKTCFSGYDVKPFKSKEVIYQIEDPKEAESWGVIFMINEKEGDLIGLFDEQDEAHQFAELLTICLSQIKTFQHETKTEE